MRVTAVVAVCAVLVGTAVAAHGRQAGRAAKPKPPTEPEQIPPCVTISTPSPAFTYHYTHAQSNGVTTRTSHQWQSVTPTGSRVKNMGPAGTQIQTNDHHIANDVAVLDRTTKRSASGAVIETTSFSPGLVSDPFFKACTGRSWAISPVSASYQSPKQNATTVTQGGSLRIVGIREKITVPAGTFTTVHYVRNSNSQSVDEYWKSTEHGVIVKHIARANGVTITETLTAIK